MGRAGERGTETDRKHTENSDLRSNWGSLEEMLKSNRIHQPPQAKLARLRAKPALTDKTLPVLHRSKPAFYSSPSCSFLLIWSLTPLSCHPLLPSNTAIPSSDSAQTSKEQINFRLKRDVGQGPRANQRRCQLSFWKLFLSLWLISLNILSQHTLSAQHSFPSNHVNSSCVRKSWNKKRQTKDGDD